MGRPQSSGLRTPAQNRTMWGLVQGIAKATGCSRDEAEETLRACCREVSGQEHSSQLSQVQANRVIAMLQARVPTASPASASSPQLPPLRGSSDRSHALITQRQQDVIRALFVQVGMEDRARQMGFCRRQCKVPWPQTQAHADQLVEPLKAMAIRHVQPVDAWRRAQALVGNAKLNAWQQQFIPDLVRQFQEAESDKRLDKVLSPHKLLKLIEAEVACRGSAP